MIVRQVQIVQESQRLVESGKTLQTRVGRCDDIIRITGELILYEERGITVLNPPPSVLRSQYVKEREDIVTEHLKAEAQKILTRAELKATPRSAIAEATKAVIKIGEARNEYDVDNPALDELEHLVRRFLHQTELKGYLTEAEKAEFKGNNKKAIDQLQEALFFLKNDKIVDELQSSQIKEIEEKILQLTAV